MTRPIPSRWGKLFALLPGYDPVATAADGDRFSPKAADRAVRFFSVCLRHVKGVRAGQPLSLEPWQQALIGCLFGWFRAGGTRRYREAFIYVARGNGKTTMVAGIILYMLFCDGEQGAEIYGAASTYTQACLLFDQAVGMIKQEESLDGRCRVFNGHGQLKAITVEDTFSAYKPVAADGTKQSGYNPHAWVIDELHEQPNGQLLTIMRGGMGKRAQPLGITISTADYDRISVCNETLEYAISVRDGIVDAHEFLPAIWMAPKDADWTSPEVWRLANPNMGISVDEDFLAAECRRAQEIPRLQNDFRRFHLNQVTEQATRFITMDKWKACAATVIEDELRGRKCCSGIDLSLGGDMTSIVLAFPTDDETYTLLPYFFLPADNIVQKGLKDKVDYFAWYQQGHLELTPGQVIDHEYVLEFLVMLTKKYRVVEHAYDPYLAEVFAQQAMKRNLNMLEFRQGFKSMNEPTQYFERLFTTAKLRHPDHPILNWHAQNVRVIKDTSKTLIKPTRSERDETKKVDGIIAAIMAVARARAVPDGTSIYEQQGVTFV